MAKLFWRYGTMSAGKSVNLLSVAHNYEEGGAKVAIFTSHLDDRFGVGRVASRLGISREAQVFTKNTLFTADMFCGISCVLVDESQFLTSAQVKQLHAVAAVDGIPVICYGIRSDFQGNGFEGSMTLGVLADNIEELRQVCSCGKKASFNMRLDESGGRVREGSQIQIGGNDRYRQTCPKCFYS